MQTLILGSAYVARSVNAADNRMVNLFPEVVPDGGQMPAFLNRAPGLQLQQTIGNGPIRGLWAHQTQGSDFYVVSGNSVYKLTSLTGTPKLLGTISGTGQVSIADNGDQIIFACNPNAYIYTESLGNIAAFTASCSGTTLTTVGSPPLVVGMTILSNSGTSLGTIVSGSANSWVVSIGGTFASQSMTVQAFVQVTDSDFPGAVTVGYLDGYFVFNEPNSQKLWVTGLLDGTQVDPLDFASAEGSPDGIVGIIVDHREVWVFGTDSTEVWYNAGAADFPLARIQGAFNEIGCVAPYSIAKLDNNIFWLGCDARGQGIVYRTNGYVGQRVSTHAIEWQIQQYSNMSDAVAYTYQQDGHAFYVLNFPSGGTTWVFDVATGAWHERAYLDNGAFTRHRGNCQCNFNGDIVIGDYENGNLYTFDLTTYADNGEPQKWLRSWRALPTGQNNLHRTAHHSLQLNCEVGTGLIDGQGSDPQVMLRWSDDGGHTWSNEHWTSMGAIGAYGYRAIWRRLGMTTKIRDRVYEVSGSDPVKMDIIGAELYLKPTDA